MTTPFYSHQHIGSHFKEATLLTEEICRADKVVNIQKVVNRKVANFGEYSVLIDYLR